MAIRNAVKAVIIHNNKILFNKNSHESKGIYYGFPGGGQKEFETLEETVIRECLEETGFDILPKKIVAFYEEIIIDDDFREKYPDHSHKVYFIFLCKLLNEIPHEPTEKDLGQIGSEWISFSDLSDSNILPKPIKENLLSILNEDSIRFLGSDRVTFR